MPQPARTTEKYAHERKKAKTNCNVRWQQETQNMLSKFFFGRNVHPGSFLQALFLIFF